MPLCCNEIVAVGAGEKCWMLLLFAAWSQAKPLPAKAGFTLEADQSNNLPVPHSDILASRIQTGLRNNYYVC